MNRVILDDSQKFTERHGQEFTLSQPEVCDHLINHIGIQVGGNLKVTLINEGLGEATVKSFTPDKIELSVLRTFEAPTPKTTLLIGASRPPTVKKILEHGSAFGVKEFIFFQAELSEKSYLTSKVFKEDKIYELLTKGLSQGAISSHLPKVTREQSLKSAIDRVQCSQKYLLSLEAQKTFLDCPPSFKEDHCLAIGPERGWTATEEDLLKRSGFSPIKVGSSTLRVEMAVFSALGQLAMIHLNR